MKRFIILLIICFPAIPVNSQGMNYPVVIDNTHAPFDFNEAYGMSYCYNEYPI